MVFMNLRQQSASIQALMEVTKNEDDPHQISKQMVKYAAAIPSESIVLVEGEVKAPFEAVKSASVQDAEVVIRKVRSKSLVFVSSVSSSRLELTLSRTPLFTIQIHTLVEVSTTLPIGYADASRSAADHENEDATYVKVSLKNRLDNRVIDLRVSLLLPLPFAMPTHRIHC